MKVSRKIFGQFAIRFILPIAGGVFLVSLAVLLHANSLKEYIHLDGKAIVVETSDIPSITYDSCSYSISPSTANVSDSGGTGAFTVSCGNTCIWTPQSNAPWITITGGKNGTGSGAVSYSVSENESIDQRHGAIAAAGKTFTMA